MIRILEPLARAWRERQLSAADVAEFMELDPGSRTAIAEDLRISEPQLVAVVANGRRSGRLLEQTMEVVGIDPRAVRVASPALMQDLAVTCALCADTAACEANLRHGRVRETLATICPNGATLCRLAG
jgi:hypothetical protein